ncbi:MAG: tape measure protein, partial [Fluviibacter sp.]
MANDIILGAKIQIDTGGSAQAMATTVKGMKDVGSAAQAAQAQFAALSKQAQQSAQSFVSLSTALGMNKANDIAKTALDAQKAMGLLGTAALSANKAVATSVGSSSNIMAALTGNLKAVGEESEKTGGKSKKAGDDIAKAHDKIGTSIRGLLPHVRTAAASLSIYFGIQAVRAIGVAADTYTNLSARLRLVTDNANQFAYAQARLFQISQQNQSALAETTTLYTRVAYGMRDLGQSQANILNVVDLLGKGMKISGASATEAASGLMQFSQAIQSGILSGDEFRATLENMPRIAKAIATGLGLSLGQLRKLSEAQQLTADKAIGALLSQSSALNAEAAKIPLTMGRAWTEATNAFTRLVAQADAAVGASRAVASAFKGLADLMQGSSGGEVSPMEASLKRILEIQKEIAQLEKYQNQSFLFRPLDVTLNAGQGEKLFALQKELRAQQEAVQTMKDAEASATGSSASRTAQEYLDAASAVWKLSDAQKTVIEEIVKIGEAEGFDPAFLLSIAKVESDFNAVAKATTSSAKGAFQFVDGTAKRFGIDDPFNIYAATKGAVKYLSLLKNQFKDTGLAAAAYHDGEGAVAKAGNRVPVNSSDPGYSTRVLKNMRDLQLAMGRASDDLNKDVAKSEADHYQMYAEGLDQRLQSFDNYTKVALAKNKTLLEELQVQQERVNQQTTQAKSTGDFAGIQQAQVEQQTLMRERNRIAQESIDLEEKAGKLRLKNIREQIDAAGDLNQGQVVDSLISDYTKQMADLKSLAEQRKQIELQANTESLRNQQDYSDTVKRMGEEELQYRQQADQYSVQVMEGVAEGQRREIDSRLETAKTAAAVAHEERQYQMENLAGLAAIDQQRKNINADLVDTINLIELEKQANLDKLNIENQLLAQQAQIAQSRLDTAATRETQLAAQKELLAIQQQQSANAQAYLDIQTKSTAEAAKARADATKQGQTLDTKEVKERQLRENAYWDQTIGRLREYAALMKEITGQDNNPWSDMALGAMEYAKSVDQISQKFNDLRANGEGGTLTDLQESFEQGQAAAAMMAKTMLVARENTEKGSQAYKNLTTASENFMAVLQLLNVAEGIAAVLKQLNEGEPYTAAIRAAGVAMMVASMGLNTGFGGGGGGLSGKDNINRDGTGGGVLGGKADEVSNSIADSLEIIKQNSSSDLNYSAAMLRALQNIESALAGVTTQVIRGVGPSQMAMAGMGSQNLSQKINPMAGFADPLTNAIHSFVMNFSTKLVGYGIQGLDQSLNDIFKSGFQGLSFTDIEKTTKVFGMTVSKKLETVYEELASPVERQLGLVFKGIAEALKAGGEAFGLTGEQVMQRIGNTTLNIGKIDLAGLSGEEVQKKLSEMFSAMTDTVAKKLMPGLKDFMQVGEGYSKTFFRVADGVNRATGSLERLGIEAVRYSTLAKKQGDVATEIVYESLMAQNKLTGNLKQFLKDLKTTASSAEEYVASYEKLMQANTLMKAGGLNAGGLSQDMTNAAGGLDAFVAAMETFNSEILGRDMSATIADLSTRFHELGYALPSSREAFADIVRSINVTDEAGQKLFGQMIALSGAMTQVFTETERLTQKYASLLDPLFDIRKRIEEVGSDFNTLIDEKLAPIASKYAKLRDTEQADLSMLTPGYSAAMDDAATLPKQIDAWLKEMQTAKPARKKKLVQMVADARVELSHAQEVVDTYGAWIKEAQKNISAIDTSEIIDKAAAKAPLLAQARDAMAQTLEDIFNGLAQSIQAAQQRLESVLNLQKSLASQLATLQGPDAVFRNAASGLSAAWSDINTYIADVKGGMTRNVETEVGLLQTAQQAVMDKYNAEIAAIQQAEQAFIAAETERLNAALQVRIDAINAATEAAVKAENDRLNAAVKTQQKIDEQVLKSQQKEFDAANKLTQKSFDADQKVLQKLHDEKLQGLQDELDAATKLRDAIKSVADYAAGLALSQNSTLSPEARLAEAQRQYQTLVSQAQGGDAEAMGKLAGASDAYLEAAKTYYGSSTNYQDIFDGVQRAMESIGGMSGPDPDSIQSRIDLLREAQAEEMDALRELQAEKLDAIREGQQDQLDAIREQQQGALDAMREASQAQQDAVRKAAQSQIEALQKQTQQAIADLSDPTKNRAMAEAKAAAERDMKELQRLAELTRQEAQIQADKARQEAADQAQKAIDIANDQLKALGDANGLNRDQITSLYSIITKLGAPIPQFANGGYAQAGMALVGEKGPEIVRFERPAQVMTADET